MTVDREMEWMENAEMVHGGSQLGSCLIRCAMSDNATSKCALSESLNVIDMSRVFWRKGGISSRVNLNLETLQLPCGAVAMGRPFSVTATPSRLVTSVTTNVSLICSASAKPILCLWKTPYGHIYTLSEGVFAESGRLR